MGIVLYSLLLIIMGNAECMSSALVYTLTLKYRFMDYIKADVCIGAWTLTEKNRQNTN